MKIKDSIHQILDLFKRWIDRNILGYGRCKQCKKKVFYSKKFDCFYCIPCNMWLESKCDDLNCPYCPKRPLKPKAQED